MKYSFTALRYPLCTSPLCGHNCHTYGHKWNVT